MQRFVVILDAPPQQEAAGWMRSAATLAGLIFVGLDPIAEAVAADPVAQEAVLRSQQWGEDPSLAAYYLAALDRVAAGQAKVALQGVSWLLYGQKAAACVLDFDNLEGEREKAKTLGITDESYDALVKQARDRVEARAREFLVPERILSLATGGSVPEKAQSAAEFIAKWRDG